MILGKSGTRTLVSLTSRGERLHSSKQTWEASLTEVIERSFRSSVAFFAAFITRLAFWRISSDRKNDQMFLDSFNASYPIWVKKGWVKKPH